MPIRTLFPLLFTTLIVLMGVVFYLMKGVSANFRDSAAAEMRRHESYKLADQLRQSSDDLTRMARTYVVTGDPVYETYFQRILDIRNGESPRPPGYEGVYWDLVTGTGDIPQADGQTIALVDLMRQAGFTDEEFSMLEQAQSRSDALVALEEQAMAAMKGLYADADGQYTREGPPDPELARQLMHGAEYHNAKARIMEPIQTFLDMIDARTARELEGLREEGLLLVRKAVLVMALAVGLLLIGYWLIHRRVLGPVRRLATAAARIEKGDYSEQIHAVGRDELAQLSHAFDQMSLSIEQDIAGRRRTAAELAEARQHAETANRAKSAFLANMSHELRTPMNAIIGYSEMLLEEFEEDDELEGFRGDVGKIHAAGQHLLALISDILDLSKIEAGRMDLFLERFDARKMLDEVAATVGPMVGKNGNMFRFEGSEDLGAMRADLTKVRQCLFNLISNAAKFTTDGTITLKAVRKPGESGDRLVFQVTDTGIGIPEDKLDQIFEEFSQADSSTTRHYGGTGLGLPISRRFCEMMGGELSASSRLGEGSTFTIELPAMVDAMEAARGSVAAGNGDQTVPETGSDYPAGKTVLVIDDDENVRELLRRRLSGEGYGVALAASGPEGLKLARELRPIAITLDIFMPSMDGWEVLGQLKADANLREIPVIVVSIASDRELGFSLGAAEYLTKPVQKDQLLDAMRRHCPHEAHVLIVEDDEPTRTVVARTLQNGGFRVAEASNGAEGLQRMEAARPDLVLLDLMMPVMDGFEFLHRLRAREDLRDVPVIVLTARELSADEKAYLAKKADSVLDKRKTQLDAVVAELRSAVDPAGPEHPPGHPAER